MWHLLKLVEEYAKLSDTASIIMDIGSRDGDDAAYLADCFWNDKVFTFEPNPDCYYKIWNKYPASTYGNFHNFGFAISNFDGESTFNKINMDQPWHVVGRSSLRDRPDGEYDGISSKITVPTYRMDTLIPKLGLEDSKLNIVKVDVEGCSYEVLDGFGKYLNNIVMLHVEAEHEQYWQGQYLYKDIYEMLCDSFELIDFVMGAPHQQSDSIWLNKKYVS